MKNEKLLKLLSKLPKDSEVCIVDWRKNLHNANDEPQGNGIEPKFAVVFMKEDVSMPFIALQFENDDYNEDGTPNEGGSIINQYNK